MAKKAEVKARRKERAAAKEKDKVESPAYVGEVRTSGSSRTGSSRDGGTTAALGEARLGTSRGLANDQLCMGIHVIIKCSHHTLATHIM